MDPSWFTLQTMRSAGVTPMVMGVLNVTPDSFSDGGSFLDRQRALDRGRQLFDQGAGIVDVGGESTRPGAHPVPEAEELQRVVPVVEGLAALGRVSIDTVKPSVARAAVSAGATLINDVSGRLGALAAELEVGWVAMHSRGTPADMQRLTEYGDVRGEVLSHLIKLAGDARRAGVAEIWIDPGIGFAKTARHNLELLGGLGDLVGEARRHGYGVLVGTSRKSFLGRVGARPGDEPLSVGDRLAPSLATAVWSAARGAGMVRVHDVGETVQALTLLGQVQAAVPAPPRRSHDRHDRHNAHEWDNQHEHHEQPTIQQTTTTGA